MKYRELSVAERLGVKIENLMEELIPFLKEELTTIYGESLPQIPEIISIETKKIKDKGKFGESPRKEIILKLIIADEGKVLGYR